MEAAFRECGLPEAMRSDTGPPFASRGFTGLTQLSAWWIRLGIRLDRTRPGSPQDNGRLERLHRTLKAEACQPPRQTLDAQQTAFDTFRREYNNERPHEALDMKTPASCYQPSARSYPEVVPPPQYPPEAQTRRVYPNGQSSFAHWLMPVGSALRGERVGIVEVDDRLYEVRFYDHVLFTLDAATGRADNGVCTYQCERTP
jgi:hypothetical protein